MGIQFLSKSDINVILESLKYSKMHIENYQSYPSYEYKQQQLARIEEVIQKLRDLKKSSAKKPDTY